MKGWSAIKGGVGRTMARVITTTAGHGTEGKLVLKLVVFECYVEIILFNKAKICLFIFDV